MKRVLVCLSFIFSLANYGCGDIRNLSEIAFAQKDCIQYKFGEYDSSGKVYTYYDSIGIAIKDKSDLNIFFYSPKIHKGINDSNINVSPEFRKSGLTVGPVIKQVGYDNSGQKMIHLHLTIDSLARGGNCYVSIFYQVDGVDIKISDSKFS